MNTSSPTTTCPHLSPAYSHLPPSAATSVPTRPHPSPPATIRPYLLPPTPTCPHPSPHLFPHAAIHPTCHHPPHLPPRQFLCPSVHSNLSDWEPACGFDVEGLNGLICSLETSSSPTPLVEAPVLLTSLCGSGSVFCLPFVRVSPSGPVLGGSHWCLQCSVYDVPFAPTGLQGSPAALDCVTWASAPT